MIKERTLYKLNSNFGTRSGMVYILKKKQDRSAITMDISTGIRPYVYIGFTEDISAYLPAEEAGSKDKQKTIQSILDSITVVREEE